MDSGGSNQTRPAHYEVQMFASIPKLGKLTGLGDKLYDV